MPSAPPRGSVRVAELGRSRTDTARDVAASAGSAIVRRLDSLPTRRQRVQRKRWMWAEARHNCLLDIGLDHLTLARAALYQAILRAEPPSGENVKDALDFLRRAGQQDVHLPAASSLAPSAAPTTGDFDGAREDLDEAFEIAERGPMRLHLADIHLHRARLFGLMAGRPKDYPWVSPRDDLDKAREAHRRPAATAGGARSSKTPRRRGSASPGPPRPLAHHRPDAGGEAADDRAVVPAERELLFYFSK